MYEDTKFDIITTRTKQCCYVEIQCGNFYAKLGTKTLNPGYFPLLIIAATCSYFQFCIMIE